MKSDLLYLDLRALSRFFQSLLNLFNPESLLTCGRTRDERLLAP